ncbi:acylneuraminate cytidylyltransferase, partial [Halarcobacter ebronensis]
DKYNMFQLENSSDDSKYRITVDEEKDFELVKIIIEEFEKSKKELNIKNIKKFLDQNQNIFSLNSNILRNEGLLKSLKNDKDIK